MYPYYVEDQEREYPLDIVRFAWVDPPAVLSFKSVLLDIQINWYLNRGDQFSISL